MYLRAAKTEAEEAGESTDGMADSISELRDEILDLTGHKVDIQLDEDNFKSTYQIIKELSEVWDDLTDVSRANLLELIAGKRNANVTSALLENFSIAEKALSTAANSAGSALEENEKYLESISGKVSIFKANMESLSWNFIDSETVKGVVDFGSSLISVLDVLAKLDILLPSVIASLVTYFAFKNAKNNAMLAAQEAAAVESLVARLVAEKATNDSLITSYITLNEVQRKNILTKLEAAVATGQLSLAEYREIAAKLSLAAATTGVKTATDGLNVSTKALMTSNPVGWILLAISLIPTLVGLYKSLTKTTDELIQEYKDVVEEVESLNSELKTTQERIAELQGADLSLVESEELNKLIKTNKQLERQIAAKERLAEIAAEESNTALVNDWDKETFTLDLPDAYSSVRWSEYQAELNAIKKEMGQSLVSAARFNTIEMLERSGYSSEEIELVKEYKRLQNEMYNRVGGIVTFDSAGEYFAVLSDEYTRLEAKLGNLTDAELEAKDYLEEELLSLQTLIDTNYLNPYVGDDEFTAGLDALADSIDKVLRPAQYLTSVLDDLPDGARIELLSDAKAGYLTPEDIDELAVKYPQLASAIEDSGLTAEDVVEHYKNLAESAEDLGGDMTSATSSVLSSMESLSNASEYINKVSSAYKEFAEDGAASAETLSGLAEECGDLNLDSLEDFVATLSNSSSSTDDARRAVNKLVAELLVSTEVYDGMTEETKQLVVSQLKLLGVTNAEDVVFTKLAIQTLPSYIASEVAAGRSGNELAETMLAVATAAGASGEIINKYRQAIEALTKAEVIEANIQKGLANGMLTNAMIANMNAEVIRLRGEADSLLEELVEIDFASNNWAPESSTSTSSDVEEYIVEVDKYRKVTEQLTRVQAERADLERELDNTDDLSAKIGIEQELLGVYEQERDVLLERNRLRDDTMAESKTRLESLGFNVEFNAEKDQFFVTNMEHINEIVADSKGEYNSLQEATNALREETEDLINDMESLAAENRDDADSWDKLSATINEAKANIVSNLKEIVTQASDAVDTIQSVYDTLKNAANEYASNDGFISVDTFQSIVNLGTEYMQYLYDENGLLTINEDKINAVVAAKTRELALENALSYISRIRLVLQGDSVESLDNLLYATTENTDATWDLVYANLALLGLNETQYEAAKHNIDAIRALADNATSGIGLAAGTLEDSLTEMKSGMDDILGYVMDMLRDQIERQIDSLEDMKDSYSELIELKKESMQTTKEETDYQDDVASKVEEIARLQERINTLSLDDSRDAQAQKAQLQEELFELEKDLAKTQGDHAYDAQQESLDKMREAYEDEKDEEIKTLEDSISSEQKLHDLAIDYIESNWDTLFGELIAWNTEYGKSLNAEIETAWDNCLAAAKRYGGYVNAIPGVSADIESIENGDNTTIGNTYSSIESSVGSIINEMWHNGRAYGSADADGRAQLSQRNMSLGAILAQYGVNAIRGSDGVWYVDRVGGELLFEKYKQYCYHTGGIVGGTGTLKENELLAKLERGEVMISNQDKMGLFSLIEFVDKLSKKLDFTNIGFVARSSINDAHPDLSNIINNQNETIHFGDVYIYGANEQTVERHREVNREFANEVLKQLNIKR